MRSVIRYLQKSLWDKRIQTILILFSIAASSSLIFANEGFQRTCEYMFYKADTRFAGTADYVFTSKEEENAISKMDIKKLKAENTLQYAVAFIKTDILYTPEKEDSGDMFYFHAYGVQMDEFIKYNPFVFYKGNGENFSGKKVILGREYASKNDLNVGDSMNLEYNGHSYAFKVVGIAEKEGIFLRELADGGSILIPYETMEDLWGMEPNLIFAKAKDGEILSNQWNALQLTYADLQAKLTIDKDLIRSETNTYVMPFRISAIAVLFMSIFITYGGFSIICEDRVPAIGIIRNLGITKVKMNLLLLMENIGMGFFGGVGGCVMGIVVLRFIQSIYFSDSQNFGTSAPLLFGLREIGYTLSAAVGISILCGIVPICKLSAKSLKEIMLQRPEQKFRKNTRIWIIGAILLLICTVGVRETTMSWTGMIIGAGLVTLLLISLILISPVILRLCNIAMEKCNAPYEMILGVRNVMDNKVLFNNFRLFSVMIAIVAFMVTLFESLSFDMHDAYQTKYRYQVLTQLKEAEIEDYEKMMSVEGVTSVAPYNINYDTMEMASGTFMNGIYGIQDEAFFDFYAVDGLEKARDAIQNLDNGNYIVTTGIMKSKFGFQLGDTMILKCNDRTMKFMISGFVDTNNGIGHVAYISGESFKKLTGTDRFHFYAIKGKQTAAQLKKNVKRAFQKNILSIETNQEQEQANADKVDAIFKSINSYTFFAVMVGIVGMINQIIGGYLERKRSLALFRCIGMSRKSMSKMILTEALVIGIIGSGLGIFIAAIMMQGIPCLVGMLWGNVRIHPAEMEIGIMSFVGIFALFLISILPLREASNLSILESMRCE